MQIQRNGKPWGSISAEEQSGGWLLCAECPQTDRVLRIWGISDGKEPLLIGIPEPQGTCLRLTKQLSRAYLRNFGYDAPPQRYLAGESMEQAFGQETASSDAYVRRTCIFSPDQPFAFAHCFAVCHIEGTTAVMYEDAKTGRLMADRPAK